MSKLEGPFSGDWKGAPSPTACPTGKLEGVDGSLTKPEDTSVLHTEFYSDEPSLKASVAKAKLESPFESDVRPGVNSGTK